MRLTHLGHACLLVETTGARVLIDPGNFSSGFDELTGLDAILVTHQHPDHVDPDRLPALLKANPRARVLIETETVDALELTGDELERVTAGDQLTIGDLEIEAKGGRHAINHDRAPKVGNVGYLIRDGSTTLFHPGDSYDEAPPDIDVLGLPLNAPWCRMSETLAFVDAVKPRTVIPIHTGLLNDAGRSMYLMHVDRFSPDRTEVVDLTTGSSYDA